MAEIVIPILALGGFYILSNEEKRKNQNVNNNTKTQNLNSNYNSNLNNNIKVQNLNSNYNGKLSNIQNTNQHTDKFYNENNYSSISNQNNNFGVGNNDNNNIKSINGTNMSKDDFTHNNMVPFFGARIRGATADSNTTESILDAKQGTGSQNFNKKESAPLFNPDQNMQFTHGMPNNSEFFQSRVNTGNNMANVTLWDQEKVAPGLNLNYNEQPNLGFNNGMSARDTWQPKTVNEMRVDTNPKMSYSLSGHEGPANNLIKEMGSIGKVEKHLPDKFYSNDPSRWFTTTGVEKAQTQRADLIIKDENRQNTGVEYFGNGGIEKNSTYVMQNYEDAKKINLEGLPISNASAVGRSNNDNLPSFTNYNNNRSTTQNQLDFGPVGGLAKAILTPIMDILRPTRKENVIGNLRQSGNVSNVINNGYLLNKNDTPQVTNRQMYSQALDFNHLNVQGQNGDGYMISNPEILSNQRETTSVNYTGSGGARMGFASTEATSNQRNNENKTYKLRPNQGGTQMFNQSMNVEYTKIDCDRDNNRMWVPTNAPKNYNNTMLVANDSRGLQTYDQKLNNDRINPDLLSAFKNNPYTQSLHSVA